MKIFKPLIELIVLIGKEILEPDIEYKIFEVEKLKCYSYNTLFDRLEEKCKKCGAPKPRCTVCQLDLSILGKEDVLQLPCCGVYAHWDHIVKWLKQNPIYPNCMENLENWLDLISVY